MNGSAERIADKQYWADQLGLLPIPLRPNDDGEFLMLNGSRGNFCFAGSRDHATDSEDDRGVAWSSDVFYFVRVDQEAQRLKVYRWDEPIVQEVRFSEVVDNLESFRAYLEDNEPTRSEKGADRILRVAEALRSALNETRTGQQAINALLLLLASAYEDVEPSQVRLEDWDIDPATSAVARQIGPEVWSNLRRELRLETNFSPALYPKYILRHAAGRLFQEANYSVSLAQQKALPGLEFAEARPRRVSKVVWQGFFTPPPIARALVEQALKDFDLPDGREIVIFDPACGSGEFLREAIRQLALRTWHGRPAVHLIGYDVSPIAEAMTRFALAAEQRTMSQFDITFTVKCCDALKEPWPDNVDLLCMNPPFVAFPDTTTEQRKLMDRWLSARELSRRPDYSHAFIARATVAIVPGGRLATVMPLSVLDAASAFALREGQLRSLIPSFIASIGNLAFFRATVDAALYVGERPTAGNTAADATPTFLWADHRRESTTDALRRLRLWRGGDTQYDGFSIYSRRLGSGDDYWVPRPVKSIELFERYAALPRVTDLFAVEQGVRTGNVSVFQLNDAEYKSLPAIERRYFRPAIVNASIVDGRIDDIAYIFYPYGLRELASEDDLERKLRRYYTWKLRPNRSSLQRRNRVEKDCWWLLAEPREEAVLAKKPKLVTTYFGDPGSVSYDDSGERAVVQGFGWTPRDSGRSLEDRTAYAYVALMNTRAFFEVVAARSKRVAGGQYNLSQHFIKDLPLPDLFPPAVVGEGSSIDVERAAIPGDVVVALTVIGASMVAGQPYDAMDAEEYARAAYEAHIT